MALWTCTNCGACERVNFYPDCCSSCGGMMETQDGRTTASDDDSHFYAVGMVRGEAEGGDEAAIVALWQMGERLSSAMTMTLDEMLVANRVAMLGAIFREAA